MKWFRSANSTIALQFQARSTSENRRQAKCVSPPPHAPQYVLTKYFRFVSINNIASVSHKQNRLPANAYFMTRPIAHPRSQDWQTSFLWSEYLPFLYTKKSSKRIKTLRSWCQITKTTTTQPFPLRWSMKPQNRGRHTTPSSAPSLSHKD